MIYSHISLATDLSATLCAPCALLRDDIITKLLPLWRRVESLRFINKFLAICGKLEQLCLDTPETRNGKKQCANSASGKDAYPRKGFSKTSRGAKVGEE